MSAINGKENIQGFMPNPEKVAKVEETAANLRTRFGPDTIRRASELESFRLSTGVSTLDGLLDGGYPRGITVLTGPENGGKTLLACRAAACEADLDHPVLYMPMEDTSGPSFLQGIRNLNIANSVFVTNGQVGNFKRTLGVIKRWGSPSIRDGRRLVVIDSLTGVMPNGRFFSLEEFYGNDEALAKDQSRFFTILNHIAHRYNLTVLITVQQRYRPGEIFRPWDLSLPGGLGLRHNAMLILKLDKPHLVHREIIEEDGVEKTIDRVLDRPPFPRMHRLGRIKSPMQATGVIARLEVSKHSISIKEPTGPLYIPLLS